MGGRGQKWEQGWVCFCVFFCVFMMAERSRCEDFESVLEQVSGRAHSE